jgi:hypothetical protein
MSLLRTKEYIDIVELNNFVSKEYGEAELGSMNSFHRQVSTLLGYPGQNEMCYLDLNDLKENPEYYPESGNVVKVFNRLIADGHLPERDGFEIEIWW